MIVCRYRRALLGLAAVALAAACGPADSADSADTPPTELPLLTLGEPSLEIGVVEGDDAYTFASVDAVRRLPDGSVAVSDAGNTRISIFDGDGAFMRSWGTQGEGPGEFRVLSRIYRHGPDSLMAADNSGAMLSVFDMEGEYARRFSAIELSQDSTFRLDSWLYGRFWIDGGLAADEREDIRTVIDRLPPPRGEPGYRRALVGRDGDLWIPEPAEAATSVADGRTLWTHVDGSGQPIALLDAPTRFTPLDVSEDEVLGQWLGPADVSFVRIYATEPTGETRPAPAWQRRPATAPTEVAAGPTDEEFSELMRGAIRQMASKQEIHYSSAFTYTTDLEALDFEQPEGIGVFFTHAHPRGWAAVFTHPTADRLCGLAYGAGVPPGWQAGAITCGPESASPAPGA